MNVSPRTPVLQTLTLARTLRPLPASERRERGFGVNPWTTHSRFLVSHRLLIDEAYTELALRALHTAYGLDAA